MIIEIRVFRFMCLSPKMHDHFNRHSSDRLKLTLYRPAMPFGNRKIYFRGSFQFSIVTIQKNITPLENRNLII